MEVTHDIPSPCPLPTGGEGLRACRSKLLALSWRPCPLGERIQVRGHTRASAPLVMPYSFKRCDSRHLGQRMVTTSTSFTLALLLLKTRATSGRSPEDFSAAALRPAMRPKARHSPMFPVPGTCSCRSSQAHPAISRGIGLPSGRTIWLLVLRLGPPCVLSMEGRAQARRRVLIGWGRASWSCRSRHPLPPGSVYSIG